MNCIFQNYKIGKEEELKIKEYKYSGDDLSILYEYFYSPLANFFVEKVIPESIA